jgi:hypothetical protein
VAECKESDAILELSAEIGRGPTPWD